MTARTTGLALAVAAPLAAWAQVAPEVADAGMEAPARILFIGNSYLYYGDSLHNHVVRMARAAYPEREFTYKSATISGAYLDHHDVSDHLDHEKLGLDAPFDLVVLQGHSTAMTTDGKRARFEAAATAADAEIDAYGARTALYMTPAYTEAHRSYDPEMFDMIDAGTAEAAGATEALVIPVGLAFEMAYERRPDVELHKDFGGSHPTLLGTYLASATTFAALHDASAVGNPYDYYGEIGAQDAAFLQQVAEDAVAAYEAR